MIHYRKTLGVVAFSLLLAGCEGYELVIVDTPPGQPSVSGGTQSLEPIGTVALEGCEGIEIVEYTQYVSSVPRYYSHDVHIRNNNTVEKIIRARLEPAQVTNQVARVINENIGSGRINLPPQRIQTIALGIGSPRVFQIVECL